MKNINLFKVLLYLLFVGIIGVACNTEAGPDKTEANKTTDGMVGDDEPLKANYNEEAHREFAMEAASNGMLEIRLSEMAIQKAKNEEVKELAQMIRADHISANAKLKEIMDNNGWNMPPRMMDKHEDKVKELHGTSEQDFDKKYLSLMVDDHQKAIDKFEKTANSPANVEDMANSPGENRQLKSWINETLPVLRKHLQKSQELQGKVGS